MIMYISLEDIRDYLYCPYKTYQKFQGLSGEKTEYEKLQNQLREMYYQAVLEKAITDMGRTSVSYESPNCCNEIKMGTKLIANSVLYYGSFRMHFDILKRTSFARKGIYLYEPTIVFPEERPSKEINHLLSIVGTLLGYIQNRLPDKVKGVFGHKFRTHSIKTSTLKNKAQKIIDGIECLFISRSEPEFYLNKHCDFCEFHKICNQKAQRHDDISLLRGMSETEVKRQRSRGIFTVTQFSYTFRPRKRQKGAQTSRQRRYHSLQARAIREDKIHIFEKPNLNLYPTQIYLDVEGLPDEGYNYLIGMLVIQTRNILQPNKIDIPLEISTSWKRLTHKMNYSMDSLNTRVAKEQVLFETGSGGAKFYSIWANDQHQEHEMFESFLDIVTNLDEFQLFHYGSYEKRFLNKMYKKATLSNKRKINRILKNSSDVLSIIYPSIYLPIYSNRMKDIGKYIGHSWSSDNSTGIQSIVWRKQWELSNSTEIRNKLIVYNMEDCICVMKIIHFLLPLLNIDPSQTPNLIYAEDLKTQVGGRSWGKADFASDDIEYVTKAAYFDYQKEKILVRLDRKTKSKRSGSKGFRKYRVNKQIIIRCRKCIYCGSSTISAIPKKQEIKTVFDLIFFNTGVKRWIVKYVFEKYYCQNCNRNFFSRRKKNIKKYSHALKSWVVYHYVANRMSLENIERYMLDVFDLRVSYHSINRMKMNLANYYETAHLKIKKQILSGDVVYVDETKIKLQKETGYVWVFTNYREVFFLFRKSRKGDFLNRYFINFSGILVSDFFSAYDNVQCAQQKCLVHLLRDINNDLLKHPYNDEMKLIAVEFGTLLRNIVQTIDRFGLKHRFLKRHEKDVAGFYDVILSADFFSDLASSYQKRFERNKDKLFVFLKHDNVNWNNNIAENAVRNLARWRRLVSGRITETGIEQFCVFLTLYVTCKLREISFLEFLLSGKRDINRL